MDSFSIENRTSHQNNGIDDNNIEIRSNQLLKESKLLNLAKLANMLVDLFGLEDGFEKIGQRDGQEVELYIPAYEGYLKFTLVKKKENFECQAERAKDPIATVVINVKEDKVLKVISEIIRSKANIIGLAKLVPKLILGKIRIKGSLMAALSLVKCIMIGKNEIYKR
ncbi:MAG: hypothetical protein GF329_13070 [Candidatus Lokiarchaeota archaeon]|nr:hypothetical protein [Candidatus Lokiarchaeota archaeon]